MSDLFLPIIAVCISLGLCFFKLITTPTQASSNKSATLAIDALMNNKNNGVNGKKYSEVLADCEFSYTGWKKDK